MDRMTWVVRRPSDVRWTATSSSTAGLRRRRHPSPVARELELLASSCHWARRFVGGQSTQVAPNTPHRSESAIVGGEEARPPGPAQRRSVGHRDEARPRGPARQCPESGAPPTPATRRSARPRRRTRRPRRSSVAHPAATSPPFATLRTARRPRHRWYPAGAWRSARARVIPPLPPVPVEAIPPVPPVPAPVFPA